jgi:hypothetical protein
VAETGADDAASNLVWSNFWEFVGIIDLLWCCINECAGYGISFLNVGDVLIYFMLWLHQILFLFFIINWVLRP